MASALTIFNGNVIADVEVSSKQSEAHSMRAVATEIPMQNGVIAANHVFLKPKEVDVAFTSSNTPGPGLTAQQAYDAFKKHYLNRDLLKLVTEHDTDLNMVIVDLQPVHKSPNKGALEFTIKFQQMNFVGTQTVTFLNAIDTSSQNEVNRGILPPVKL